MRAPMVTSVLIVIAALVLARPADAHTTLTSPPPRTQANKAGPCGAAGSTRGTDVTTFAPGETITVEWDETVDHPGHYRIAFDQDGDDDFPNPSQPTDAFPTTLADQIPDKAGGHYTLDVALPDVTCTNCTLQLIQIMTTSVPYDSFYFQCADLVLDGTTGGDDTGGGASGGCSTGGRGGPGALLLVAAALLSTRRRARR